MKRISAVPYVIMITLCMLSIVQLFAMRHEVAAQTINGPEHTPDALQALSISMQHDPNGQFTVRGNYAAHEWHAGTDTPSRPDGLFDPATGKRVLRWPIIYVPANGYPSVVFFGKDNPDDPNENGRFRSTNWYAWGRPKAWAYLRMGPEVWNGSQKRMVVPGVEDPTPPVAPAGKAGVHMDATQGQWMVDDLKRSFTTTQIQNFIDASPYDEPDTGAPEPQS